MQMPSHIAPLDYAAAMRERGPALRAAVLQWQAAEPVDTSVDPQTLDGTDAAARDGLLDLLCARGVALGGCGRPAAADAVAPAYPLRPGTPDRLLHLKRC